MQAFEGIRVLDFTHVYAGPFASYQLAVMGAEVIKIESPQNLDMMRTDGVDSERTRNGLAVGYLANNQGKKSICLDLTRGEGREIARRLIESADVLVENYTYGPEFDDYCARAGEDTDAILADIGISSEQIKTLREASVI